MGNGLMRVRSMGLKMGMDQDIASFIQKVSCPQIPNHCRDLRTLLTMCNHCRNASIHIQRAVAHPYGPHSPFYRLAPSHISVFHPHSRRSTSRVQIIRSRAHPPPQETTSPIMQQPRLPITRERHYRGLLCRPRRWRKGD